MNEPINDGELDGILAAENEIIPSSRFVASVMAEVRHEAAMEEMTSVSVSTPFPWGIALGVPLLCLLVMGGMMVGVNSSAMKALSHAARKEAFLAVTSCAMNFASRSTNLATRLPSQMMRALQQATQMGLGWLLVALLLSYITVELSMGIAEWRD